MGLIEMIIIISVVTLCIYELVNRICKCVETCSLGRSYALSKAGESAEEKVTIGFIDTEEH